LQEDQNKLIIKEKEKVKKAEELEQKRLKDDEEYQRKQVRRRS
jgi:hypothetical protein